LSEAKSARFRAIGASASAARPRLLFVDDEENIRLTLPRLLEQHGFHVTAVATVADALVQISTVSLDALITDLNVHREGDGFLVITAVRRAQPKCKNFILTGYPGLENAIRAIQSRVDDYFTKPADIEELVAKIKTRLAEPPAKPVRLAAVLMESEREVIAKILEAIKRDDVLRKARVSDQERVDHLPSIFQAVISRLMHEGRPFNAKDLQFAARHGRRRKKDRYTVPMLVREFQLVGETIYALLGTDMLPLGAVELTSDLKLLTESLNAFTLKSFEAYSRTE
jgi:two-component system, NtrC family, C4-dicarboxylate transport response regulator DctD